MSQWLTMNQPQASKNIDEIKTAIRSGGLRATPARVAVLFELINASGPLTHADLVEKTKQQSSDPSTIFRALNDLSDAGLLRRMELGDHVWRYELVIKHGDADNPHAHFLCLDCGEISCLEPVDLKSKSGKKLKVGEVKEVLIKGQCNDCS